VYRVCRDAIQPCTVKAQEFAGHYWQVWMHMFLPISLYSIVELTLILNLNILTHSEMQGVLPTIRQPYRRRLWISSVQSTRGSRTLHGACNIRLEKPRFVCERVPSSGTAFY